MEKDKDENEDNKLHADEFILLLEAILEGDEEKINRIKQMHENIFEGRRPKGVN